MNTTRRNFIGGALALGTAAAYGANARPNLVFGVMSDVHIGGKEDAGETLEKVLRWFAGKNVDAVLCTGDIAHSGLISQMEKFAETWHKVFPGGMAAGGRKVELMIATGNHDVDAWSGRWKNFTESQLREQRFCHGDNAEKTMQRLFGQKWELIWRREVKGYTFIGSQWSSLNPPIEKYMKENAATLDPVKPFFYAQHPHPKDTCHGKYAMCTDNGASVRALSAFPNAVAITGHSHCAISDERTVWQGAFTSIGAGCIHEGAAGFEYDNSTARWHASYRKKLMASMADPLSWGGDAKGGGCELVEVFDGHLVVHRHSVAFNRPVGPAFIVPLPARKDGPLDFARRAAKRRAPQFAPDARIEARYCPHGHVLEGVGHKGEPCVYVSFPRAQSVDGCRVFEYMVEACAEGGKPVKSRLIAAGYAYPEECADLPGECLFAAADLPAGKSISFTVTPYECFGTAGRRLTATVHDLIPANLACLS